MRFFVGMMTALILLTGCQKAGEFAQSSEVASSTKEPAEVVSVPQESGIFSSTEEPAVVDSVPQESGTSIDEPPTSPYPPHYPIPVRDDLPQSLSELFVKDGEPLTCESITLTQSALSEEEFPVATYTDQEIIGQVIDLLKQSKQVPHIGSPAGSVNIELTLTLEGQDVFIVFLPVGRDDKTLANYGNIEDDEHFYYYARYALPKETFYALYTLIYPDEPDETYSYYYGTPYPDKAIRVPSDQAAESTAPTSELPN